MKNGYKLGLAVIVTSLLLVGCGSSSDTTPTETADTTTSTDTESTLTALEEFVLANKLTFSGPQGTAVATYSAGGSYGEVFGDSSGSCNGTWTSIDDTILQITCGGDVNELWEFIGELRVGMDVIKDGERLTIIAIN
ncbi:hypothetical protein C9926_03155 [Sulfurovum lithotrophicum]|nr:hypothetical protein C9926_03155 [Sulfurovum lithotrophicum]